MPLTCLSSKSGQYRTAVFQSQKVQMTCSAIWIKQHRTTDSNGNSEFDDYLKIETSLSCIDFWMAESKREKKSFPRLLYLHHKYHCLPASSAAMERCFSASGYIVNARRSSLSDSMIEHMLLVKCNSDLFLQQCSWTMSDKNLCWLSSLILIN